MQQKAKQWIFSFGFISTNVLKLLIRSIEPVTGRNEDAVTVSHDVQTPQPVEMICLLFKEPVGVVLGAPRGLREFFQPLVAFRFLRFEIRV